MSEGNSELRTRAEKGDPVALTRAMVAVPSVNPELEEGGGGEEAMARLCADWLEAWGFQPAVTEPAPGRWNVVARRGSGGRTLILNGHLDTVGVRGMQGSPFCGELREGRVWGRGACDMKGGLGVILAAAAATAGEPLGGEMVIALTADEEHASLGMQAFVDGLDAPADRRGPWGAVVCEPTGLAVMPAHKGFLWLDAEFRGRAAHGSRPEEGVDAILHAGRFLAALQALEISLNERPPHPLLARPSFHAGTIEGGSAPSVYPDRCRLVLERRTLPGEDAEEIRREFQDVLDGACSEIPGLETTLTPGLFRPGTEVGAESPVVRGLRDALKEEGLEPRLEGMTAWVDAAFLNEAGVPAVCFGPGSIARAHAANEWVPVSELEAGARVLTRFVRDFLKAPAA